ncbi:MAG: HEAT repeat domain-containing protein [Planctomycetota bacterium]|nr:HEAT repeat domain-containing protein [Planctomycetota bacterium]
MSPEASAGAARRAERSFVMIQMQCPKCERMLNVPDSKAGQDIVCPSCQETLHVPGEKIAAPEGGGRKFGAPKPPPQPVSRVQQAMAKMAAERREEDDLRLEPADGEPVPGHPKPGGGQQAGPGQTGACPSCGAPVKQGDVICHKCGFNFLAGTRLGPGGEQAAGRLPPWVKWAACGVLALLTLYICYAVYDWYFAAATDVATGPGGTGDSGGGSGSGSGSSRPRTKKTTEKEDSKKETSAGQPDKGGKRAETLQERFKRALEDMAVPETREKAVRDIQAMGRDGAGLLAEALQRPDAGDVETRAALLRILLAQRTPAAFAVAVSYLKPPGISGPDILPLRALASEALQRGGPAAEAVLGAALVGEDRELRALACAVIGEGGLKPLLQQTINCLKDEDPRVRAAAARALGGRLFDDAALDPLIKTMDDPVPVVAVAAARALAANVSRQAVASAVVSRASKASKWPEFLRCAIPAMTVKDREAGAMLARQTEATAGIKAGESGDKEKLEMFKRLLEDTNDLSRLKLLEGLATMAGAPKEARAYVAVTCMASTPRLAAFACRLLGRKDRGPLETAALGLALLDPDWETANEAAEALAAGPMEEFEAPAIESLPPDDLQTRIVLWGLKSIAGGGGSSEAGTQLGLWARSPHPDPELRALAVRWMARAGTKADDNLIMSLKAPSSRNAKPVSRRGAVLLDAAAARSGSPQGRAALLRAMAGGDQAVAALAAREMLNLRDPQSIDDAISFLKSSKTADIAGMLVHVFVMEEDPARVPQLVDVLKTADERIVDRLIGVVASYGAKGLEHVGELLKSDNRVIRLRAMKIYGAVGTAEAMSALVQALKEEKDPAVQSSGFQILRDYTGLPGSYSAEEWETILGKGVADVSKVAWATRYGAGYEVQIPENWSAGAQIFRGVKTPGSPIFTFSAVTASPTGPSRKEPSTNEVYRENETKLNAQSDFQSGKAKFLDKNISLATGAGNFLGCHYDDGRLFHAVYFGVVREDKGGAKIVKLEYTCASMFKDYNRPLMEYILKSFRRSATKK